MKIYDMSSGLELEDHFTLDELMDTIDIDWQDPKQIVAKYSTRSYCEKLFNHLAIDELKIAANYYFDGCLDTLRTVAS